MAKSKKAPPDKSNTRTPPDYDSRAVDEDEEDVRTPAEVAADDEDDYLGDADEDDPPKKAKKPDKLKSVPKIGAEPVVKVTPRPVIVLDHRKLTKKDQEKLETSWKGRNRGKTLDAFFSAQAELARKQFGHKSVFLGSEADTLVIGIPCPSLAFEFVIAQDCFPLGLVMQIVAKHGVGKSGLLAEIGRWFNDAGGGMVLCENETKFNPHWYRSIMGKSRFDRMQLHRCKSVEDWQRHLTWAMKKMKSDLEGTKEAPGPGRTVPVLFGVDSIMGKMSEENQEKVLGAAIKPKKGKKGEAAEGPQKRGTTGDGFAAARSFPIEAGSITKYLRTIPQEFDEWPFGLVLINHLRMKTDDMGHAERNKTGGEQVNFQESFELELKKIGGHKKKIECAEFEGIPLELSCEKNSFGPTHRRIQTRVLWWDEIEEATGDTVQKTAWDWDWSTTHLLNSQLSGEKSSPRIRAALKAIDFDLTCPSAADVENTAWSKAVGVSAKDPVTWSEMGALIREDKDLMDRLRRALRITRRPLLAGDYLAQLDDLVKEMP